jgi:protein-arginine kinase activator protein McsA
MSDDELRNLMRSAIEDEDYEFASEIRDILKNR